MMFAHTAVELPKYGASSREAAISVASVAPPATKTSTPSRRGETSGRRTAAGSCTGSSAAGRTRDAGRGRADIGSTLRCRDRRNGLSGHVLVRSLRGVRRTRRPGGRVRQNEREIGLRIAAARREAGLTQAEFARLV